MCLRRCVDLVVQLESLLLGLPPEAREGLLALVRQLGPVRTQQPKSASASHTEPTCFSPSRPHMVSVSSSSSSLCRSWNPPAALCQLSRSPGLMPAWVGCGPSSCAPIWWPSCVARLERGTYAWYVTCGGGPGGSACAGAARLESRWCWAAAWSSAYSCFARASSS